jgi:hypothetical protein
MKSSLGEENVNRENYAKTAKAFPNPSKTKREHTLMQSTPSYKRGKPSQDFGEGMGGFECDGGRDVSFAGFEHYSDEIIDDDFDSAAFSLRKKPANTDILNRRNGVPEQGSGGSAATGRIFSKAKQSVDPLDFMFK